MTITDLSFLFLFFPLTLATYYICRKELRNYVLFAASLFFYACSSPDFVVLLMISLVINIGIGKLIIRSRKRAGIAKILLIIGTAYNLSILFYYKYFDLAIWNLSKTYQTTYISRNLLLPLGLSFFTFKAISYLADIYHGKIETSNNPIYAALYLSFFGQVQSGPLSRYSQFYNRGGDGKTFYEKRITFEDFSEGAYRFIIGFNKKILLANTLANITGETFSASSGDVSMRLVWLGAICYSMQLFFDFSGYSDMAIGISQMLGFGCPENFNYPYMTASVSEFWRRWHITLGAWFRDYVYIPLGGSRVKNKNRVYLNLFVVWLLTGIWHGSSWNYIFWGLAYFIVIAFEKTTGWPEKLESRLCRILYRIVTLLFINFQWVIFRADGMKAGLMYMKSMVWCSRNALADARAGFLLRDNFVFITAAILLCFPIIPSLEKYFERRKSTRIIWNTVLAIINGMLFLWAVSLVIAGRNNPFAYANF